MAAPDAAGSSAASSALGSAISDLVTKRKLDAETMLDEIEDVLIRADLGLDTADRIADRAGAKAATTRRSSPDDVKAVVAAEVEKVLDPVAQPLAIDPAHKPFVILVAGVNGSGKTTTIGKLAAKLPREGRKVMLAAGDTFRAAAIEQLKIWGERAGAEVIAREAGRRRRRPRLRCACARRRTRRRRAADRHRRPPAEPQPS